MARLVHVQDGFAVGVTEGPDNWQTLDLFTGYQQSDTIAIGDRVGPDPKPPVPDTSPSTIITRSEVLLFLEAAALYKRAQYAQQYPSTSINDLWPHLVGAIEAYEISGPKPFPNYPSLYGALSARVGVPVTSLSQAQLGAFVAEIQKAKAAHTAYLQSIEKAYKAVLGLYDRPTTDKHNFNLDAEWAKLW